MLLYEPDYGKYYAIVIDDALAGCTIYGSMIEEWRTAPMLAKVNQAADIAMTRQVMGDPDLDVGFQSVRELSNAPWQSAAIYTDETCTRYSNSPSLGELESVLLYEVNCQGSICFFRWDYRNRFGMVPRLGDDAAVPAGGSVSERKGRDVQQHAGSVPVIAGFPLYEKWKANRV